MSSTSATRSGRIVPLSSLRGLGPTRSFSCGRTQSCIQIFRDKSGALSEKLLIVVIRYSERIHIINEVRPQTFFELAVLLREGADVSTWCLPRDFVLVGIGVN